MRKSAMHCRKGTLVLLAALLAACALLGRNTRQNDSTAHSKTNQYNSHQYGHSTWRLPKDFLILCDEFSQPLDNALQIYEMFNSQSIDAKSTAALLHEAATYLQRVHDGDATMPPSSRCWQHAPCSQASDRPRIGEFKRILRMVAWSTGATT